MLISAIFIVFYTIPVCLIAIFQIRHIKMSDKVVILDSKDFDIAKNYAIISQYFHIFESVFSTILFVFWVVFGFYLLQEICGISGILSDVVFVVSFLIINAILNLPLSAYKTLVIDKSFGFSKTSIKLYIIDTIKSFLLLVIFASILSFVLIYLMNYSFWWIFGFILVFLIVVLINLIYPTIIAPLFNKFSPLENKDQESQITKMMDSVGFRANGIFVMDASKRDGRLNAYFGGLGKSKRVVLFDTLLSKVTQNELLAILGHELAHFKHKDLIKNIGIMAVVLFCLFFVAGNLPSFVFDGFSQTHSSILCVLILISSLISFYFLPFINYFSRIAEYRADEFGSKLTNKTDLGNALIKLINENKAFPYSHRIYIFFYMSHPPLLDRLKALNYQFQ